ncbi:MAG: acetolactate decarboxylase [Desulfuromonas sp.]
MKRFFPVVFLLLLFPATVSATTASANSLVQFSTIDALLSGLYDGVVSIADLRQQGDLGIGTFHSLDGEMVVLEGQVYRIDASGQARQVPDSETSPFASVTHFAPEQQQLLPSGTDLAELPQRLSALGLSPNHFYALRLDGHFRSVHTRSVPRQQKPYRPLVEVVQKQPEFHFDQVDGSLIGFYCPPFVRGINVPGYHLHFLDRNRTAGGHVLDFVLEHEAVLHLDRIDRFVLQLPADDAFTAIDLQRNREMELRQVEQ